MSAAGCGTWALVVEVDVICFSSCADYVFPAGRARVIRADAFVGWHGNERQFDVHGRAHGRERGEINWPPSRRRTSRPGRALPSSRRPCARSR